MPRTTNAECPRWFGTSVISPMERHRAGFATSALRRSASHNSSGPPARRNAQYLREKLTRTPRETKPHPGRKPLPENLPRVISVISCNERFGNQTLANVPSARSRRSMPVASAAYPGVLSASRDA